MKTLLIALFMCSAAVCKSQTVLMMDFVKVKEGRMAEALYFYENNWKLYRDIALGKNYISAYRIESVRTDSSNQFDLVLITEYPTNAAYEKSEENFSDILKAARPNGPLLLNDIKPDAFRQNIFVKVTQTLHKRDD